MADMDCPGCEQRHDDRWLCDPGKALLDAIAARAGSYTLDPIAFDAPVPAGLDQVADVVMAQITVTGGTAEVAGVPRPLLVISGMDMAGKPLPRWLHIGTVQELTRTRNLFDRMVSLAIDAARQGRRGGGR